MDTKNVGNISNVTIHRSTSGQSRKRNYNVIHTHNFFWCLELDNIGEGATCSAFRCRERKTGDIYVAKVFSSDKRHHDKREIDLLKNLQHPNIVKFIALEETAEKQRALILEYCDGKTLHEHLKQPENWLGLADLDLLQLLHNVCDGLSYIYEKNLLHRDIKPANILRTWCRSGQNSDIVYKLGDFGSSREVLDNQECQSLVGTYEYLHPKIYHAVLNRNQPKTSDELRYHYEADLWSLGVTLYQAASGRQPFRPFHSFREDLESTLSMIQNKPDWAIAGVQDEAGGEISWSSTLPLDARLSTNLSKWVSEIIQGVLVGTNHWTPEKLFKEVFQNKQSHPVYFFNASNHSSSDLVFCPKASYQSLIESLSQTTQISSESLYLHYEGHKLESFPMVTSRQNPILLFNSNDMFEFASAISDFDLSGNCFKMKKLNGDIESYSMRALKDFIDDALRILIYCKRLAENCSLNMLLLENCTQAIRQRINKKMEVLHADIEAKKALFSEREQTARSWQEIFCLLSTQIGTALKQRGFLTNGSLSDDGDNADNLRELPARLDKFGSDVEEMLKCATGYHQNLLVLNKLGAKFTAVTEQVSCHQHTANCTISDIFHRVETLYNNWDSIFEAVKKHQVKKESSGSLESYARLMFGTDSKVLESCVDKAKNTLAMCCCDKLMRMAQGYEDWLRAADDVSKKLIRFEMFVTSVEDSSDVLNLEAVQIKATVLTDLKRYFEQRLSRKSNQFTLLTEAVNKLLNSSQTLHDEFSRNQRLLQELDDLSLKNTSTVSALLGSPEHSSNESEGPVPSV